MGVFDELKERGFIAQTTNEEKIRDMLENERVYFYVGFDPTADSLHVGSFVQMMVMAHMQKAGHVPIVLFGGGTSMIGDPTGKTDMRKMLTKQAINHNISCFKEQMSRFIDFSEDKAIMVNNADWLLNLNYIEFLRDVGVHFPVNKMLAAECYKQRLERGLSFFELNYMVMQSYDFLLLNQKYGCKLEVGGNDQWSNIIGGVELIRKKLQKEVFGMTFGLLTTSDGKKMGKTEKGALWLDPNKTSPYDFYQYWRNVADTEVIKCLKILTFLPMEKIEAFSTLSGSEINAAKEALAFEVTALVHGEDEAKKAKNASESIFNSGEVSESMPTIQLPESCFSSNKILVAEMLTVTGIVTSKSEARRLIDQGGLSISINGETKKVTSVNHEVTTDDFEKAPVIIKKGKKSFHKITL